MTLSSDPTLYTQHQYKPIISEFTRREIILIPVKAKIKRGYNSITIKLGNETYSIVNENGNIQLLQNGEHIEIDSDEETKCSNMLKKPFDVSVIDQLRMKSIVCTDNDRLNHIVQTNQYKSVFNPITPDRMREWNGAEK